MAKTKATGSRGRVFDNPPSNSWIRTLQTKKPFGINVESGKPVERYKIIFPIIYNRRNVDIGKIMKEEYLNLQTVMKKPMARPVIAYRTNPSLKDMLVSTRLPTNTNSLTQSTFQRFVLFSLLSLYPNTNNSKNIGLKTKQY